MNELGNTPADKNYKPSGISKAGERALEIFPSTEKEWKSEFGTFHFDDTNVEHREGFIVGYEQAEKDTIAIIKDYVEKGIRCMEQSDKFQMHTFWDGFHNCAENILRELEEKK